MDTARFETELERDGYQQIETKHFAPNLSTRPHVHDFHVRALVTAGEVTLTWQGRSQTFRVGDTFEMAARCEHSEQHGPEGTTYVVGRKS